MVEDFRKKQPIDAASPNNDLNVTVLPLSDVPTMPIVDKLKEALKPGRKETGDEGDLNKLLASSAKKVLLQKIEFEPASKGFSYQLDSLKNKYVILNPRNEGATCQKATEPAQIKRQGKPQFDEVGFSPPPKFLLTNV